MSHGIITVRPRRATLFEPPAAAPRRPARELARHAAPVALFTATIFVNAALLFTVEPMFSKMVLPLLGGTPSVWNTCMLFFQGALLAGYGYAWALARWPLARQLAVHLALLALSLATLPIAVARGWTPPPGGAPIPWLIALLAVSLGAPFLLLSAGAPLLQRWFAETGAPSADDPYFLYAASNLGSLLALLAYPFVLEPSFRLSEQSAGWTAGYAALLVMLAACARLVWRRVRERSGRLSPVGGSASEGDAPGGRPRRAPGGRPPRVEVGTARGEEHDQSIARNAGITHHAAGAPPDASRGSGSARARDSVPGLAAAIRATGPPPRFHDAPADADRHTRTSPRDTERSHAAPAPGDASRRTVGDRSGDSVLGPPHARERVRWTLLAAVPSSLLLGITTYLTTDIAPVPLLWVVPLALYLLSFVLVFARRQLVPFDMMLGMQTFAVLALTILFALGSQKHVTTLAPIHLVAFFTTAMVCHGELVRTKPPVSHLTEFYVWISVGGLVGGAFNVLVAPIVFSDVLEYPIALVAACLLRPAIGPRGDTRARVLDVLLPVLFGIAIVVTARWPLSSRLGPNGVTYACTAYALICLAFLRRPVRFGLGVAAIMLAFAVARGRDTTDLLAARSFFGVYHVRGYTNYHAFQHGTTTHGGQSTLAAWRREPLTYYHRDGPLGQMFASLMPGKAARHVAIVGLGTGTIACYARPGERWTYYEIDPLIVRIATDPRYFTYLRDCAPGTRIVLGDARLSLEHAPDGEYDFIILDAFSSDAIPAHLITREALALYLRKLAPGGVVAFHISNRYLKLEPVLSELARDARVAGAFGGDTGLTRAQRDMYKTTSEWIALSRHATDLALLVRQPGWRPLRPQGDVRLWTDDFSDILSVFEW